jgi:hypothetical protein
LGVEIGRTEQGLEDLRLLRGGAIRFLPVLGFDFLLAPGEAAEESFDVPDIATLRSVARVRACSGETCFVDVLREA